MSGFYLLDKKLNDKKMKDKLIVLFVILAFVSCKTTKTVTSTSLKGTKDVSQIVERIQKNQTQFSTANVSKMSMALKMANRNLNVSATCKVRKDSVIHLSIQPFMGIELFKAELTPDSIKVFDKMNNKYYFLDYNYFSDKFGVDVDFFSLQSLIFGQLFCIGEKEILLDKIVLKEETNGRKSLNFENETMQQSSEISNGFNLSKVVLKSKNENYELKTNYSDYSLLDAVSYPQKISMEVTNPTSNASCDFSILRVEFNSPIKFQSTNPSRYNKGDIDQLLTK